LKRSKYFKAVIILTIPTIILNILACIPAFCNIYADSVYGVTADVFGRLTGRFSLPLGEILMYVFALIAFVCIISAILLIFLRRKQGFVTFAKRYMKFTLILFLCMLLIYTLNWIIPYRSDVCAIRSTPKDTTYSLEEVRWVRNHFVNEANRLSLEVERDSDGNVIYPSRAEMLIEVTAAMQNASTDFPRLKGYVPPMKDALCSPALEWMSIGGYTYPYTMEITCNKYCSGMYYPVLLAHEESHHHGYYHENEGEFLAFYINLKSDVPRLKYCAYLGNYYRINNAYIEFLKQLPKDEAQALRAEDPVYSDLVRADIIYASNEQSEQYNNDAHPLENMSDTAEKIGDTGWDAQAAVIGENNYDGIVKMLLDYYADEMTLGD